MKKLCILWMTSTVLISNTTWAFQAPDDLQARYKETADKLAAAALSDEEGWSRLTYLCDRIGHRLSGSRALERAVEWSARQMREAGFEQVMTPQVKVPHWVRGEEEAWIVSPVQRHMPILGLGGSIATPVGGILAEVVAVKSFDELQKLGRAGVEGKIVLYDVPYQGYGRTVRYRGSGPSQAAALGAVAALVRSVGPVSLQTPHTGATRYDPELPKIPAAAVTHEDSALIQRLLQSGEPVQVRLRMQAALLPDALSHNVIGEIRGREKPEEVVVMGGHLDSWDVGQGAHDDGAGAIAALQAVALIKRLGLQPRRTIRVILWTNEENGLAGARAYFNSLSPDQVKGHVAGIEMDGGAERPVGFGMSWSLGTQQVAEERLKPIADLLQVIGAGRISWGGGGADIGPLMRAGVPGFGLRTVGERYFHWHHTRADTLDKIDKDDFRKNTAALAILSYMLADMPERLDDFLR